MPRGLLKKDFVFANTTEKRFYFLQQALKSDAKAIWCLRGGSGAQNLLPYLAKLKKPRAPKIFIGLSDISALHIFFNQKWNWPTWHASIFMRLTNKNQPLLEKAELQMFLSGKRKQQEFSKLQALNKAAKKTKKIKGAVVGGNLATLCALLGSPWQPKLKGKILFLEDIGERGYKIERMLTSLENAGVFQGLRAIVLGDFTYCEEANGKDFSGHALKRFAENISIPVLKGIASGHGDLQRLIPFQTKAVLQTGKKSHLRIESGQ